MTYARKRMLNRIAENLVLRSDYLDEKPFKVLAEMSDANRRAALADAGDTYRGMPTTQYLKILDLEGFETVARFPTPAGSIYLFGRRADGTVVILDDGHGIVVDVCLQTARYTRRGDNVFPDDNFGCYAGHVVLGESGIYNRQFMAADGVHLRLAEIERSHGRPCPFWPCSQDMHLGTLFTLGGWPCSRRGIVSGSDLPIDGNESAVLSRHRRLPAEWLHILDIEGRRTAREAHDAMGASE